MNKFRFYILFLLIVPMFLQCGPTKKDAIEYNNNIVTEERAVIIATNNLDNAVMTYNSEKIEKALEAAKIQVSNSIRKLKEIGSFEGDSLFVNECLNLFKLLENQLDNEYTEQFEIYSAYKTGDYNKEDEKRSNELFDLIGKKYKPVYQKVDEAHKIFSTKWKIEYKDE